MVANNGIGKAKMAILLFLALDFILLAGIIAPYANVYALTVPFAMEKSFIHEGDDNYVCSNYTIDMLHLLRESGYKAHYVLGHMNSSDDYTHAWVAIEHGNSLLHIEPQNGMATGSEYRVLQYDPPVCWRNIYTESDGITICPYHDANFIINEENEEVLHEKMYYQVDFNGLCIGCVDLVRAVIPL